MKKENKINDIWFKDYFGEDYISTDYHPNTTTEIRFIKEVLGLKKGMSLIDTSCGYGRHLIPLKKKGIDVVGCDLSNVMLGEAKKRLESAGYENPKLVNCDYRNLPFGDVFDCACNMFNSFGFFAGEDENFQVLKSIASCLKPGGLFLLDLTNRDYIVRNFPSKDWFEHKGTYVLEKKYFNPIKNRTEIDVIIIDKDEKRDYYHSIRVYSFTELSMLLEAAGFYVAGVFGGFEFEEFNPYNKKMIVISRKRENYDN